VIRVTVEMPITDAITDEWKALQADVEAIDLETLAVVEGRSDEQLVSIRARITAVRREIDEPERELGTERD
jgi:hypothetical protein